MNEIYKRTPFSFRKEIPFFYQKSEEEFRIDPYERYEEMVLRQTCLHFGDAVKGEYPFQKVFDLLIEDLEKKEALKIAEIGCGVGRMIGEFALRNKNSEFFGIDYSYQMLRQARDYWLLGKTLDIDGRNRGFRQIKISGKQLNNLNFALAKAGDLPFKKESLDMVFSSFLIDRVENPISFLEEIKRVLKPKGKMLLISPLNFQNQKHWETFHPVEKLTEIISDKGFYIKSLKKNLIIKEPLDAHGNFIHWNCLALSTQST